MRQPTRVDPRAMLPWPLLQAADVLHLTRGRESEAMQHPYLAALRQLLLEMLPRPTAATQLNAATTPAKGEHG